MAQTIEEQVNVVERALGERMIEHAMTVIRAWLNELGEGHPYEAAFSSIQRRYKEVFDAWLGSDDAHTDEQLNALTGEAYQLADAAYADLRLKRGLSPDMHGFNPKNPQSVMQYFGNCLRLRDEDYQWLHDTLHGEDEAAIGLIAVGALVSNMRENFSIPGILAVIDGMYSDREVVSEQCMAYLFTLLIHYDIRIDYFPQIQNAFITALRDIDEDGERAFEVLCALVRSVDSHWTHGEVYDKDLMDQIPEDLRTMLSMMGMKNDAPVISWMPKSEQEYMQGLIQLLPDTWLYSVIIADDPHRENLIAGAYLTSGHMDLMWNNRGLAEKYLREALRKGSENPHDYINYGHCLLLKGDRIMAYENYKQARALCKNSKEFLAYFRPDRAALADHGIPLEQVYLIEDQLLKL